MATQKVTPQDLKQFKDDLLTGLKEAFGNEAKKVFDKSGNEIHLNGDNRKEYFDNLYRQNKKDKQDEIQRQIDELATNTSKLADLKRKELKEELERSKNGGISKKDEEKYKQQKNLELVNKISGAISGLSQIASAVSDGILAARKSQLKEGKNLFDKTQKTFQANLEMTNVVASNIISSITSFTTQLATEAAQSLTKGAKEEANARIKLFTSLQMAEKEYTVAEEQRKIEKEKGITAAASGGLQGIAGIASLFGPVGMIIGGVVSAIGAAGQAIQNMRLSWKEFDVEKMEQFNAIYQQGMERAMAVADKMKNITDGLDDAANSINNYVRETDNVYRNVGLSMGFSGDEFSSMMRETAIETARIFGTTAEEMKNIQEAFIANSSRAVMLNGNEYNQMTAISKTFGVSQGEVASIMGTMNIFNVSIDQGYEKFDAMYHTVTKMGLSTTKFAKDLNNNLKLAQKYNFKGGVDNMMKLTKWAQQTRFNLNSAASFADSIMNDSLSGALEKSAKLQVLGGSAAMYSDPLGMLYDAGADVGNMAQRMAGMFNDITGTFNKKTGETDFSWYENRMIAARAQALGMDPGEVKDMIRQNNKQGAINRVLRGSDLDKEDKLAIGNRAQYKDGKWVVNTRDGEKTVEQLAAMKKEDRENILLPENQEDAIMDIAENTRSMLETEKANLAVNQAIAGGKVYSTAKAASDKNIEAQNVVFGSEEYINQMKESITNTADIAYTQAQKTKEFVEQNREIIAQYRSFVKEQIKDGFVFTKEERNYIKTLAIEGVQGISNIAAAIAAIANNKNLSADEQAAQMRKVAEEYEGNVNGGGTGGATAGTTTNLQTRKPQNKKRKPWSETDENGNIHNYRRIIGGQSDTVQEQINGKWINVNDGYGSTNGGMIIGASNVKSIHDGAVKTSIHDGFLAAETGGPIDILLKQILPGLKMLVDNSGTNGSSNGTANINFGGKIELSQDGSTLNLVDLLKNNPSAATKFITMLTKAAGTNTNGKPEYSYNMF